jgi:hypothetical protein
VADAPGPARRRGRWRWRAATAAVLAAGIALRLALDAGGVGNRAAAVMMALLGLSAWTAAALLGTPRAAFLVTLGLVALLDLAALPPRTSVEYDDRQAFYRTDQLLVARVPTSPASVQAQPSPVLTLLVEPVFGGPQPQFGLAGEVGGAALAWDCTLRHGLQRLALPVPAAAIAGAASIDIRLHLTGSPSRESDYLLVYTSSARGGFLVSLVGAADVGQGSTICAPR